MSKFLTVIFKMSIFFCFLLSFNTNASSVKLGSIKEAVKMGLWYEGVSIGPSTALDVTKKSVNKEKLILDRKSAYPEELLRVFKKYQY